MIQAVADDEERGALGMHYTSVPNILKVLNPLFLDDLRAQFEVCADNKAKLLNLRKRMARIRVFDPACGSGNFLVIAYKQMREIEAEINRIRGEEHLGSEIPLTNFRGIELRDFPAEIARLALIIAEFQCDVLYRGQQDALAEFLPLDAENWIVSGNALRLDWLNICPPTGTGVKVVSDDLFNTPLDQKEIDFENEGGETYICGNPPYKGSQTQTDEQKSDLEAIFKKYTNGWKSLDYVSGWFMKAAEYGTKTTSTSAFVSTNSICQGRQVESLWTLIFSTGHEIAFAHTSFKWANLASHNAGVTVIVVGISKNIKGSRKIFSGVNDEGTIVKSVNNINAYLVAGNNTVVAQRSSPLSEVGKMDFGSMANDNGGLLVDILEAKDAIESRGVDAEYFRSAWGAKEFITGISRKCLWLSETEQKSAIKNSWVAERVEITKIARQRSTRPSTRKLADVAFRFGEVRQKGTEKIIIVPSVSSERREFLPCGYLDSGSIVIAPNLALYDAPLWNLALVASRIHLVWIATVCGKLKTDFRYSNTLGWNTFPLPLLTEKNKLDLTASAETVLLAREAHFPLSIADLYEPEKMPANLRLAHEKNDEVIERIYIGRRFKNDTERLEKLFEMYEKMTAKAVGSKKGRK